MTALKLDRGREALLAVLREHGPMTADEAAAQLPGFSRSYVHYMLDGFTLYAPPQVRRIGRGREAMYEAVVPSTKGSP